MKITYDWLKDHLKTSAKEDKLLEKLTDIGLEVESIENLSEGLDLFKVAKIVKTEKHPNADRLNITVVNIGEEINYRIVCGAPNVKEGQKVVVAKPDTIIYPSNGEPFKIKKAKIRGEESCGMICAKEEIGLEDNHEGIIVLDNMKALKKL